MLMDEPLPLVTLNEESGEFQIVKEAFEMLQAIEDPVYVVAIAGIYRTGKSFVLNQLVGKTDGFDIGSTIEPCTQGIWLWLADETNVDVAEFGLPPRFKLVMLDTEGLGSFSKSETYDIQIFSLSLLLSSYFIYNSLGSIDETAIDRLSLVLELSKHIQAQTDSVSDPYQLKLFFPSFLWLVRDFSLELSAGGRQISSREYLENALLPSKGDPSRVGGKNAIRNAITQFFGDRDCYTMKRPVGDEEKLQNLRNLPLDQFRPEYLEQMKELKKKILTSLKPKTMFGSPLNGTMLAELMENYVKAINEGGVPVIKTAWENVSLMQCQKALDDSKAFYTKTITAALEGSQSLDLDRFIQLHRGTYWRAYSLFRRIAVGDEIPKYEKDLKDYVDEQFSVLFLQNASKSQSECDSLITGLSKHTNEFINSSELSTIAQLKKSWEDTLEKYTSAGSGPRKSQVLSNFVRTRLLDQARRVSRIMVANTVKEGEEAIKKVEIAAQEKYSKLEGEYTNINAQRRALEEVIRGLQSEKRDAEDRLTKADGLLQEQKNERKKIESSLDSMNHRNADMEEEIRRKMDEVKTHENRVNELKKSQQTTNKQKEELQNQVDELQNRRNCSVM